MIDVSFDAAHFGGLTLAAEPAINRYRLGTDAEGQKTLTWNLQLWQGHLATIVEVLTLTLPSGVVGEGRQEFGFDYRTGNSTPYLRGHAILTDGGNTLTLNPSQDGHYWPKTAYLRIVMHQAICVRAA